MTRALEHYYRQPEYVVYPCKDRNFGLIDPELR